MPELPSIHLIHASDAPDELEALRKIFEKLKAERRIASITFNTRPEQLGSFQDQVKDNDAVLALLTFKLERIDEIKRRLKELKSERPSIKVGEIIVDLLPYEIKFITFPRDLGPIRGRTDIPSVWDEIEKRIKDMFPREAPTEEPEIWKKILKYALAVVVVITLITLGIRALTPKPPELTIKADFRSDKSECEAPCTVAFTNASQHADTYRWDFGNGDSSKDVNPSYTFTKKGKFTVKLTALRKDKQQIATHVIIVDKTPIPTPLPQFTSSTNRCLVPCDVNFTNQSQKATSFRWDFGDGGSTNEENPSHRYRAASSYQVTLVAINDDQLEKTITATIRVENTKRINPTPITTTGADAQIVAGDDEINSDYCTRVKLSYSIRIVNDREIRLTLTWYAQELNSDQSLDNDNTQIRSSNLSRFLTLEHVVLAQ